MLGRKIYGEVRLVLRDDPAVIKESYADYADAGFDFTKLKFVEGQSPTVFTVRPMTYRQKMAFEEKANIVQKIEFAVRCGLVAVSNFTIEKADGTRMEPPPIKHIDQPPYGLMVAQEWLEGAGIQTAYLVEIGTAIISITEVPLKVGEQ